MSRFGLPSFRLLIVGTVAAAAVAYYMGEFPDKAATGARTTQPAVVKAVRPDKPLSPKRTAAPASLPAKTAVQPRPTKALAATGPGKPPAAVRPAEAKSAPRPPAMLTGSIVGKPRPPESLPPTPKK